MTEKDKIFIEQHKFMSGETGAAKMLSDLKKQQPETKDTPKKVYISIYGGEVHVNGPLVSPVLKPETLAQKIARFERLAEHVRANRALLAELAQTGLFDDEESEEDEDKAMEEVESVDEFGEKVVVKSQTHMNFVNNKATGAASDSNDVSNQQSIADDESAQIAAPSAADSAKPSDMVEQ